MPRKRKLTKKELAEIEAKELSLEIEIKRELKLSHLNGSLSANDVHNAIRRLLDSGNPDPVVIAQGLWLYHRMTGVHLGLSKPIQHLGLGDDFIQGFADAVSKFVPDETKESVLDDFKPKSVGLQKVYPRSPQPGTYHRKTATSS